MPQEFHVLLCYNCQTYQVQIVKKVPKWQCKMCMEKQSVKKVYSIGTSKDCRLIVQELNQKKFLQSEILVAKKIEAEGTVEKSEATILDSSIPTTEKQETTKWLEFINNEDESSENLSSEPTTIDESKYTFVRQPGVNKRKRKSRGNVENEEVKHSKLHESPQYCENNFEDRLVVQKVDTFKEILENVAKSTNEILTNAPKKINNVFNFGNQNLDLSVNFE